MELERRIARLERELARARRRTLVVSVVAIGAALACKTSKTRGQGANGSTITAQRIEVGNVTVTPDGLYVGDVAIAADTVRLKGHDDTTILLGGDGLTIESKQARTHLRDSGYELRGGNASYTVRIDPHAVSTELELDRVRALLQVAKLGDKSTAIATVRAGTNTQSFIELTGTPEHAAIEARGQTVKVGSDTWEGGQWTVRPVK